MAICIVMTSLYRFDYERLNENSLKKASLEYAETANRDDPKLRIVAIKNSGTRHSKTCGSRRSKTADKGDKDTRPFRRLETESPPGGDGSSVMAAGEASHAANT